MKRLSVSQAAQELGISPQRIRALVHSGRFQADRVGGNWIVHGESLELPRRRSPGRPLAASNAWALLALINGDSPDWVHPSVRSRLRRKLHDSEWLIQALSYSEPRAQLNRWRVLPSDLPKISSSYALVKSGLSAADRALDVFPDDDGALDAYVGPDVLAQIGRRFRPLDSSPSANVILRVPSDPWPLKFAQRVPPAVVAADLLSDADSRVGRAARSFFEGLAE